MLDTKERKCYKNSNHCIYIFFYLYADCSQTFLKNIGTVRMMQKWHTQDEQQIIPQLGYYLRPPPCLK